MSVQVNTNLNGKPAQFEVEIEDCALDILRDQAGLTGAKLVCGSGACGACTVLVNGAAKCGCLLPATSMENAEIVTIEGQSENGLHPVQKAFLAHDGLQCGYCTPGFIVEGIAFYDKWRKMHGNKRPTRSEIAHALAGHLCRCGAYVGIYRAMADACEGKFESTEMPDFQRVDAIPKITGAAKYTTDIQLSGQLVGRLFRCPFPHAKLTSLNLDKAKSIVGVKAVMRIKEGDVSYFEGDIIAAVAAETPALADQAIKAIEANFEVLEFVMTAEEAMREGAPLVFPEGAGNLPSAAEGFSFPGSWEGNVKKTSISLASSQKGKAKDALEELVPAAETNYSARFKTPTQYHCALEPHCAVAHWTSAEKLEVYASTQGVYHLGKAIAKAYDLKDENLQVFTHYVGGAFGAKQGLRIEIRTAIDLAKLAQAPVSVIYSRAEELLEAGHRPASLIDLTVTADSDGRNATYSMDAYGSSGVATGSSIADISGLCYTGIAKNLQDYDVVTHFQPGAPFRGPGGPAAFFALEQGLDQLAHQLNMDPLAFRRKWEDDEGFISLFNWVENASLWKKRQAMPAQSGRFRKGIGLAFGGWIHVYMHSAEVEIEVSPAGIVAKNALQDMGQGSKSVLAKGVADALGISLHAIIVEAGNSQLNEGPTSAGSRTATSIYPTAVAAATKFRESLLKFAEKDRGLLNPQITESGIAHAGGIAPWAEFANQDISERAGRGKNGGFNVLGMLPLSQGMRMGEGRAYGCYLIEVEVDTLLGKTRVTDVEGVMRVGNIHVRSGAESQCYGGVIQGIGHVLYEDRALCPATGKALARGLEDYRLPGIGDIPEMKIDFLEEGFDKVKQKGIGLAELCTVPVAGAVANAIFDATGWRPLKAPILPEEVIKGLKQS